jgi:hypothetical protein
MLAAAAAFVVALASAPNMSLATLPVGYYGSSYMNKTDLVYDMFSKMRFVILMQQDGDISAGHCWVMCCPPGHWDPIGRCTANRVKANASLHAGCNPTCDQHGKQTDEFVKIKAVARAAGRPEPHALLYMNTVYDWPFDATHGLGAENIDVLDIHGKPHTEMCDPGIYPSFFLDHGRPQGQAAFQNIFQKYIVDGAADGVYLDCFDTNPLKCNTDSSGNKICTAIRNKKGNTPSIVSEQTVIDYAAGLSAGLANATKLVAAGSGGMFTAKTWNTAKSHDPYGANTALVKMSGDPDVMLKAVAQHRNSSGYPFLIFVSGYSNLARAADDVASTCTQDEIAAFMLVLEAGCYLTCQGWDRQFEYPLGAPLGAATTTHGVMRRKFTSGTEVQYALATKVATIHWAGHPSPPPTPPPPSPMPPPPPTPLPLCPGPGCPPVPATNFQGCFVDKTGGVCDLPVVPDGSTGHCPHRRHVGAVDDAASNILHGHGHTDARAQQGHKSSYPLRQWPHEQEWPATFTVEYCNALCAPLGSNFFGLQAGHACFCGNTFGSQGKAAAKECDSTCTGNSSEICGGLKRNSVYAVQLPSSGFV